MSEDQCSELALVVGAARSGTTLLRLLLDAHPQIGCPAEAGLPALMSHMAQVWVTVDADILEGAPASDPGRPGADATGERDTSVDETGEDDPANLLPPSLRPEAAEWIYATMLHTMRRYCDREGKRLYVDKSLDSVFHLDLVQQVFPNLKCVLAFRHVMDTIASGIEASPWGFQAYGYGPYVQATPGNTVAALARYWLDHVTRALAWERHHPDACFRVRYEDLVTNPGPTMEKLQTFLGVSADSSVLTAAFDGAARRGPGDYKIEHTEAIHTRSVGHGKRVPITMLPAPLLTAINEKLEALQYPPLDRSWNAAERAIDSIDETTWSTQLQSLMTFAIAPTNAGDGLEPFALVCEDRRALRWVVDPEAGTITRGDGSVAAVLTGTAEDLVLMVTDQENLGVLLRSGRVRHVLADFAGVRDAAVTRGAYLLSRYAQACVANGAVKGKTTPLWSPDTETHGSPVVRHRLHTR